MTDIPVASTLPGQGVPDAAGPEDQVTTTTPAVEPSLVSTDSEAAGLIGGASYRAWGWPVVQHRDQIRLSLHRDASAIAIPILLSNEVIRILTARHCAPAALAHPYAPGHCIVLTGERFGATLPWPTSVHQITGTVLLPPTVTPRGPVTWIQSPLPDSMRLSREIDVFGALRTALSSSSTDETCRSASASYGKYQSEPVIRIGPPRLISESSLD
jgi:hypothetical protein